MNTDRNRDKDNEIIITNPELFSFIFGLFKYKSWRKIVGISGIWTRIHGVEGEHADHLTTTTAQTLCFIVDVIKHVLVQKWRYGYTEIDRDIERQIERERNKEREILAKKLK